MSSVDAAQPIALPAPLANAASEADAKIVLVIGAGCSVPAPTSVPMAKRCSEEAYRRLLADKILAEGDCSDPSDLSVLAEAVYRACDGKQAELVERLPRLRFQRAVANDGYYIAAALLRENVVSSILTLNFDLAMEHALTELGAQDVHKIARPGDMPQFGAHNVVYLHRNADEPDVEAWVLRSSVIDHDWEHGWEKMLAQVLLTSPVVVFAGLGSPAAVLLETTKLIKASLANMHVYQADPYPAAGNRFFQALELPEEAFIELGWNELMKLIGDRAVTEQLYLLGEACTQQVEVEAFRATDATFVIDHLRTMGLVELGRTRATWLSQSERYSPQSPQTTLGLANLSLATSAVASHLGAAQMVVRSEVVEFRDASGVVLSVVILASGNGHRGWMVVEEELRNRMAQVRRFDPYPQIAIVAGATGRRPADVAPPSNIVSDERPAGDILAGDAQIVQLDAHDICSDPAMLGTLI